MSCERPGLGGRIVRLLRVSIPPGPLGRLMLVPILGLGAFRAYEYLIYAWSQWTAPTALIFHEAFMALMVWRAQSGLRLYPDWWDYPHVANFFAPLYFELIGLLAAATGAGLTQIFLIGRAVSILCGLLTSLIVGVYLGRRHGVWAGVIGAILSLGPGPMRSCSVVVRPDTMAELLGIAGLLLVGGRSSRRHWAGCLLIVLAFFTKQTSGVYLLAAASGLFLMNQRRRAGSVLGVGLAAPVLVVALTTLTLEPNFAHALLGEGRTPWDDPGWSATLRRFVADDPDLLVFAVLGLWVGSLGPSREVKLMSLAVVVLVVGFIATRKMGGDVNYFGSLRVVEGMAVALLWRVARVRRAWQLVPLAAVAYVGAWALVPGAASMKSMADLARVMADPSHGGPDCTRLPTYREIARLARDPKIHLLTDVGLFDLYQRERAIAGNPLLFRTLVETGQVEPARMCDLIDREYYDLAISMIGFESPLYPDYVFGFPMSVVERVRAHYVPIGMKDGLHFYGRRHGPPARLQSLFGTGSGLLDGSPRVNPDLTPAAPRSARGR